MLGRLLRQLARARSSARPAPAVDDAALHANAMRLNARGSGGEALALLDAALERNPALFWASIASGDIRAERGELDAAARAYRRTLELQPPAELAARVLGKLAAIERARGQSAAALAAYRRALELDPQLAELHYNLALALGEAGEVDEATACLRRAIELKPEFVQAHSSLLGMRGLYRHADPAQIRAEHVAWAKRFADPLTAAAPPHTNDLDSERRLSIGYVSGDFREHSISYFIEPILANHDRSRFRIFCYDSWPGSDAVNARLQRHADCWRKIDRLSDDDAAAQIRGDAIDVLIDLSGHTTFNRLMVFARKPAPVQASWLGYMCTTGLEAMDYRITDAYLDPPGATEQNYVETLLRIRSAAAFSPAPDSPPVNELPALRNGHITFGSFNNYAKITDETLGAWGRVMRSLPDARLLLVAQDGDHAARPAISARLERLGIPSERVRISGRRPMHEFLQFFHEVDIALDPFPNSGGTTSLHMLWMGVPTVTLVGTSELSRGTAGMLQDIGLMHLVTESIDAYCEALASLARDSASLAALRSSLRGRMQASTLLDSVAVTRSLESSLREIWRGYATGIPVKPPIAPLK
jgi:protein O-GlcNAc transferase